MQGRAKKRIRNSTLVHRIEQIIGGGVLAFFFVRVIRKSIPSFLVEFVCQPLFVCGFERVFNIHSEHVYAVVYVRSTYEHIYISTTHNQTPS